MDNLDRDIREAKRLGYGVHYGRYKADYPHTREVPLDVARPVKLRNCKKCGKEYAYDHTNGLGYFCSESCKKQHYEKINSEAQRRYRSRLESQTCGFCGNIFKPSRNGQRYCCASCAARSKGKLNDVLYTCAKCGKQFKPKVKTRKYCSVACCREAKRKRSVETVSNE